MTHDPRGSQLNGVPPLLMIHFYLTGSCNLRCRHCWIDPRYEPAKDHSREALDLRLFQRVVLQALPLGLKIVKLSGGEPLLHPRIEEILKFLAGQRINVVIETNGILCDKRISRRIAACQGAFVAVSLDGVDAVGHDWMRGVRGSFHLALEGIRHLVEAGLRPQIIMSLHRRNHEQMEAMAQLARSIGAGSVKFNIIQPITRGRSMARQEGTLSIEELVRLGRQVEEGGMDFGGFPVYFDHPPAFSPMGRLLGPNGRGIGKCKALNMLGGLSDGSYALCGIGTTVRDLVFGHAEEDPLEEVWRESEMLQCLRQGLPDSLEGICGRCLMRQGCMGACVAANYYQRGSFWGPFWYCHEAWVKGLFPASRVQATKRGKLAERP